MIRTRIPSFLQRTYLSAAVASGVLLGVSQNSALAWGLSLIGLMPLLWLCVQKNVRTTPLFFYSWLTGSIYFAVALIWFWHTLPLDWLGIPSMFVGSSVVGSVWLSVAVVFGVFVAVWAVFVRLLYIRFGAVSLIAAPLVWAAVEYARLIGFSILTIGAESLVGPHFSLGALGYALANNNLLVQVSAFGDVYALSALAVLANVVLFLLLKSAMSGKWKVVYIVSGAAVLLAGTIVWNTLDLAHQEEAKEVLSIAAIHTSFDAKLTVSPTQRHARHLALEELVTDAAAGIAEPGIIVLPEDSRFLQGFSDKDREIFLTNHFGDRHILFVDSGRVENANGAYQEIVFYDAREKTARRHTKQLLVPMGEYMPYAYNALLRILGQGDKVRLLDEKRAYARGSSPQTTEIGGARIAGLFCSELLSPALYREFALRDADVFVNVASQSWFHHSGTLFHQTLNTAKVRAVANRTPLVYAANGAPAFILDIYGRVQTMSERYTKEGVVYGSLAL